MARKIPAVTEEVQGFVVGQLKEAQKRVRTLEKELVKRGRSQQKELEALIKSVRQGKQVKAFEKQANVATNEVKKRLDTLQGQVLSVLGVATRSEIHQISRELTRLAKKVDALVSKKSSVPQLNG
jgi:polyhydroxyalkanoate synthesis regulator phasin